MKTEAGICWEDEGIRILQSVQTASGTKIVEDVPRTGSLLSETVAVRHVSGQTATQREDEVAIEEPLEIRLIFGPRVARQSTAITVTMRTPGHDAELAAGFLLTEGVLRSAEDILAIRSHAVGAEGGTNPVLASPHYANTIIVEVAEDVVINPPTLERNFYMTSSCGVCGKGSLLALRSFCPPRTNSTVRVNAKTLHTFPSKLRSAQAAFNTTGGLHGAGLFSQKGDLLLAREDVGRHNAVDKLIGAQLLADQVPLRDHVLLLSGRASFELLQKAVMAGIAVVAAVGAPSSLAIRVAQEFGVTLAGFLRDGRFNIYTGAERIEGLLPSNNWDAGTRHMAAPSVVFPKEVVA